MAFLLILGILAWAGQIMAIISCFMKTPPTWLRIWGAIGAIIFVIGMLGK